jgi:hypothetical protein
LIFRGDAGIIFDEELQMKQSKFPQNWDEKRVQQVIAHYEEQTEDEATDEDEAAFRDAAS